MIETRCNNTLDNTENKHLSYIFYIYILVLVICHCLLFHCGCVGFCYCCGGKVKDEIIVKEVYTKEIKKEEKKEEKKIKQVTINFRHNGYINSIHFTQTLDGKVDEKQIVGCGFVNEREVYYLTYNDESHEAFISYLKNKNYKVMHGESGFWEWVFSGEQIKVTDTYLFALVTVNKDQGTVESKYLVYCPDANIYKTFCGLFYRSEVTKIEILSCGSEIKNMDYMFYCCTELTKITFHYNFDTSNVKNMKNMFNYCNKLQSLNLSNFKTSNVKNMDNMFSNCSSLQELNLSNFNISKVKDMNGMFLLCFQNGATLICTKSAIDELTKDGKNTFLSIDGGLEIKGDDNTLYECTIEKDDDSLSPTIKEVKEYNSQI